MLVAGASGVVGPAAAPPSVGVRRPLGHGSLPTKEASRDALG